MNHPCTIEGQLPLRARKSCTVLGAEGRVPRVARLLALALRFEKLVSEKQLADYSTLARLGHVSRARISQIMNLLLLAPDIQEAILFLPLTRGGRDPIRLAWLQPIALTWSWDKQRRLWSALWNSRRDSQDSSELP
jgi:hypothetical protein